MFCEKCGAGLREGDRFCSQCGAPVNGRLPLSSGSEKKIPKEKEALEPWYEASEEREEPQTGEYIYGKAAARSLEPEEEGYLEEEDYLDEEADQADLLETENGRYLWGEDWEADPDPGEYKAAADSGRYAGSRDRQGGKATQSGSVYYDENLYRGYKGRYRDSFLKKKEDKSHAMLTTVTILLVMAVLVAAFLILFFFMTRSHPQMPEGDPEGIQILSEETGLVEDWQFEEEEFQL